jgi:serine/threonine-protein kinase
MSAEVPSTGLIAGKYELVGLIGRGGMGSVWEGRHATLGTRVAIKFIEKEYADSQEARNRFDNEARAAATIQSKHAIQIHDHGVTHDGKPYIVMELLVGEPLDKRIERLGRLSLQDTARILQQVSRGLQRAHERGIVHRDLKPENIFLVRSPDDEDEIAKVLDFGIAKIRKTDQSGGVSSSTKTGAVLGTPFYMSPEQARGLRNVDHRTDVWSLGVIAFKCVTGRLPFEGESIGDLLVKICTAPVPVPSQVLPGLPTSFDAWFARALDRDPERRFSSVQELSDALAYAAGVSVRRGPGSAQPSSGSPNPTAFQRTTPSVPPGAPTSPLGGVTPGATPRPGATPGGFMQAPIDTPYGMGAASGSPGMTSAPLTSSTRVPVKSRTPLVVSAIVGVIALSAGIGAVTFFVGKKNDKADPKGIVSSSTVSTGAAAAAGSLAPTAPASDPTVKPAVATDPVPTTSATVPPTPTATTASITTSRPTTSPTTRPTTKPTTTTRPTTTTTAIATTTPTPTPTLTTKPTTTKPADPGPGY